MTTTEKIRDPRIEREVAIDPSVTLTRGEAGWMLDITRDLRHEPEQVWRMLTDPEQLVRWSPVVADRPLDAVGPATSHEGPGFDPQDATVLSVDPPRELVHHWGTHVLHWRITPLDPGTRLELRHTFDQAAHCGDFAGGWHVCLSALAATRDETAETDVSSPTGSNPPDYGWTALRDRYRVALVGEG